MSKSTPNKKTGTARWNKYGPFAAQLFRDLYFKKYTRREQDNKFDALAIFNDPTRDYHKLNKNSFYQRVNEIEERVRSYRANGTGLGTSEFRQLVNLKNIPPPEDWGQDWQEEGKSKDKKTDEERALSSDSDDSSYFGANKEDEELEGDSEPESVREEEEEDKKMPPTSDKKKKKAPKEKSAIRELEEAMERASLENRNGGDMKYMYKLADGRICCVFQLISGFEGNFEFNKGKPKTKVMLKRVMPRWSYKAQRVFRRKSLGPNDMNVVKLQTMMDAQRKKDVAAMEMDPETYSGPITRTREVFDVASLGVAEVLPFFLDKHGHRTSDINADAGNGAKWVFFWLRDKDTVKEAHPIGRIVRNNTRGRDDMSDDDEEGARPRARSASASPRFYDSRTNAVSDES